MHSELEGMDISDEGFLGGRPGGGMERERKMELQCCLVKWVPS